MPSLEINISSCKKVVPDEKILASYEVETFKAKDSGKFLSCGKADLRWRTKGHNAILMKNTAELLNRQPN